MPRVEKIAVNDQGQNPTELEVVSLSKPYWHAVFFVTGAIVLIIIGVSVRFILDLSAADDRVFSIEALVSGLIVEYIIFRKLLQKRLVMSIQPNIPFVFVWPILCLYVFVARPFE